MKVWTVSELDNIVHALQALVDTRLQEVYTGDNDMVFGFYTSGSAEGERNGHMLWLWLDLNAIRPTVLPWVDLPRKPLNQKSPVQLFLRAHFVGRTLRKISRVADLGRVLQLQFGAPDDVLEIEVRLFPHGRNLLLQSGSKSLSWQKPKELPAAQESHEHDHIAVRSLDELREQWLAWKFNDGSQKAKLGFKSKSAAAPAPKENRFEKELKKKQAAVKKVEDELQRKVDLPWRAVGEWIKQNQILDVPAEWDPFVDRRRKLAWNIEQCFTKARDVESKMVGTRKRLQTIESEIRLLQDRMRSPSAMAAAESSSREGKPTTAVPTKMDAQRRTLKVSDQVTAVMGKSAADNLKILRQARAWDLWFHMRDYPSSHAVVFRNKGARISDTQIQSVAEWFIRQQLGAKSSKFAGEKFALLIAECRHVHPIKGDKIGRVTYRDERLLIFQFPG